MDALLQTPIFPIGGSILVVVYFVWQVWRVQRDIINPYREENARLRVIHLESAAEKQKCQDEREACAREREVMRVAMQFHGIPFSPDDWGKDRGDEAEEGTT